MYLRELKYFNNELNFNFQTKTGLNYLLFKELKFYMKSDVTYNLQPKFLDFLPKG